LTARFDLRVLRILRTLAVALLAVKPVARGASAKRMSTVVDLKAWARNPNRPRLSPEEAEAFERDIEAARKHLNTPPVDKWELY